MGNIPGSVGDRTRQWVSLFRRFPRQYREDEEIARWVAERRVGPLIALLDGDRKEARQELDGLRRRYPNLIARVQRENRGEFYWDEHEDDIDYGLTDRQWEERERQRDREAAEYEWVNGQYLSHAFVLRDRSQLIDEIRELDALEKGEAT